MARKPRLHIPGGMYHVLLRGNGGDDIFFHEEDRTKFFLLLQEGIERYSYRLHAFCLMTNHIHLVIQVSDTPLSKIVQNISFRYTKFINKKKKRIGHLFQGRYKAILIDADNYMLELVRYIHNNPVRANLVADPLDYPWSSHSAYLGREKISYLTTSFVLEQFGNSLPVASKLYQNFVRKGLNEGYRREFHAGKTDSRILGDDTFVERKTHKTILTKRHNLDKIASYVCSKYKIHESELSLASRRRDYSQIRGIIAWLSVELGTATLTDVGKRYNRDLTTLSRAANRIADNALSSKKYKATLLGYLKDLDS